MTAEDSLDLELLFSLSLDLLCVASFDGYFLRVNPAFQRLLGHDEGALLRRPFIDFVHDEDRDATLREVAALSRGAHTIDFENRYRCADGSYRWLAWRARPAVDRARIFAVARDMTAQREAAHEHAALVEREARERARLEATAGILHDIGNVLTGMNASIAEVRAAMQQAAMNNELPRTARFARNELPRMAQALGDARAGALVELIEAAERSSEAAQHEIERVLRKLTLSVEHANDLLETHRRERSGEGEAPSRRARVATALHSVQAVLGGDLAARGITLDVSASEGAMARSVEVVPLVRALLNGVRNARDALDAREGGAAPTITLRASLDERGALRLVLTDNGHGFSGAPESHFVDGQSTRARGSGRGLGEARRALASIGGEVTLASDGPGRGAVFTITLP